MDPTLSPLEDATLRLVLGVAGESDGWVDLTRVSSRTGRMLVDVRQAVARLERRGLLSIDHEAANTERWIRFVVPEATGRKPAPPTPAY